MAVFCSCRQMSDTKIIRFMDKQGRAVSLKEVQNACAQAQQCCGHAKTCTETLRDLVDTHNGKFQDKPAVKPDPALDPA